MACWKMTCVTGSFQLEMDESGHARFEVRDYGLPSREMCSIFKGYFAEYLRASGWVGVTVQKHSCVLDHADACAWIVTWEESR